MNEQSLTASSTLLVAYCANQLKEKSLKTNILKSIIREISYWPEGLVKQILNLLVLCFFTRFTDLHFFKSSPANFHPRKQIIYTPNCCVQSAMRTREAVMNEMPSIWNGDTVGRGSNRLGWLHTFLSCINTFITLMQCPVAKVSLVLKVIIGNCYIITIQKRCDTSSRPIM